MCPAGVGTGQGSPNQNLGWTTSRFNAWLKSRRTFAFDLGSLLEIAHPGETGMGYVFLYRFQKPGQVSGIAS
jgi:hypothetical protein